MKNICRLLILCCVVLCGCNNVVEPTVDAAENIVVEEVLDTVVVDTPEVVEPEVLVDYDTLLWQEILEDDFMSIDLKYATTDNFVGEQMYDCARCFLQKDAAIALLEAKAYFKAKGYGMKLFDCYRPVPVQQKLWDKVPNINYVAPPSKGSMHNRGATVDMTLTKGGVDVDMGTAFDAFTRKSFTFHPFEDSTLIDNRMLLRNGLYKFDYRGIRTEWWHFTYYKGAKKPLESWLWNCPN